MRELNMNIKSKVIKLFFTGLPYEEISQQLGISKGSVVNIIDDFREGNLPLPPGITEYIDTLRQLAVDLKKNNTTVVHTKACLKLDVKLREMGILSEQAEQWLDICHGIASTSVSNNDFIQAGLELARLASENGLSYEESIAEYKTKLNQLKHLNSQIEKGNEELNKAKLEKERATGELDSITRAMNTAQDAFRKHSTELKSEQDRFLAENKLSWNKIKLVTAAIDSGLSASDLSRAHIERIRREIIDAGSLHKMMNQLKRKRNKLQDQVNELIEWAEHSSERVKEVTSYRNQLDVSILGKVEENDRLDNELETARTRLTSIEKETAEKTENLYMSKSILDFLSCSEEIDNNDLDRLTGAMIALRQNRLGVEPTSVIDRYGKVICKCLTPVITTDLKAYNINTDHVRGVFAHLLTPLVKDKFVSKFDHDIEVLRSEMLGQIKVIKTWSGVG